MIVQIISHSVQVRDGHYTDEFRHGAKTVLVWEGTIEGHKLQSFELIEDDAEGRIVERSVAMRPYPVVSIFRNAMAKRLAGLLPEEYWAL